MKFLSELMHLEEGAPPKNNAGYYASENEDDYEQGDLDYVVIKLVRAGVPYYTDTGLYIFPVGTKHKYYDYGTGEMDIAALVDPNAPGAATVKKRAAKKPSIFVDALSNPKNYCLVSSIGGSDGTEGAVLVRGVPDFHPFHGEKRTYMTKVVDASAGLILINMNSY